MDERLKKLMAKRKPMLTHYLKVKAARRALNENQTEKLPTDKEIREMADKNPTVAAAMLRQRKRINNR